MRRLAVTFVAVFAVACGDGAFEPTPAAGSPPDAAAPGPDSAADPGVDSEADTGGASDPDPTAEPEPEPGAGAEVAIPTPTGRVATFTVGAHTVRVTGPSRTFRESRYGVTSTVVGDSYVYLLPRPFDGAVDPAWLAAHTAAVPAPDLLAAAMQYLDGAPPLLDDSGHTIAGDAGYGATIGADFNDFIGIPWTYPDGRVDPPDAVDAGNLDCSGYVRMIFGFRGGLAMSIGATADHRALPRTSHDMFASGPGVALASDLAALRPGDLVFFDASGDDGVIDHVGVYLGVDTLGHHRMLNSRSSMRGPTLRDGAGTDGETTARSILDGAGLYARSFHAARRL